jgi:hypothetical protein
VTPFDPHPGGIKGCLHNQGQQKRERFHPSEPEKIIALLYLLEVLSDIAYV